MTQDHVQQLMELGIAACVYFNDAEEATRWLKRPNIALHFACPGEYASRGLAEIAELRLMLNRMEHGVYT
ncbi:MbcA/ParS/Xre antitoxin family protein [Deinococcus multiflagellatus]|uniref:Antitoxin Xre/MbcA/ParS toxin-binding domain-containing protein n=1 Tax=Deinococcus multiflagellatus TaxID=1656887 RepID=A0ABW1ZG83_9DEIO|nr:MbcA/ParS/Xre antitoxin family protein [Deinococcus multiflagellatus]MBZ9712193.1 MbcA/ParS/Xre antitoxin family protein [Deinococcus multiflagellatus]